MSDALPDMQQSSDETRHNIRFFEVCKRSAINSILAQTDKGLLS